MTLSVQSNTDLNQKFKIFLGAQRYPPTMKQDKLEMILDWFIFWTTAGSNITCDRLIYYHILINNNKTHRLPSLGSQGPSHELVIYKRDLGFASLIYSTLIVLLISQFYLTFLCILFFKFLTFYFHFLEQLLILM